MAAVVEALEGPVALTECSVTDGGCSLEADCLAKSHWGPMAAILSGRCPGCRSRRSGRGLRDPAARAAARRPTLA